jgi:FO synthase subunit 1
VQPYSPGETEASRDSYISKSKRRPATALGYDLDDLPGLVKRARHILPADVVVQVPPNLVLKRPEVLQKCLEAGATDLGGISPFDVVNPSYPFPTVSELRRVLESWGYVLKERLPLHDKHQSAPWVRPRVLPVMEKWSARMHDRSHEQCVSK